MQRRFFGWAAAILLAGAMAPGVSADRVFLKSGDVLSGRVLWRDARGIILEHPALGRVEVPQSDVKYLEIGPLPDPSEKPSKPIQPKTTDKKYQLALGFHLRDRQTEQLDFHTRFTARHESATERSKLEIAAFVSKQDDDTDREDQHVVLQHDWLLPDNPRFYFGEAGYDHDAFKRWENRATLQSGVGYDWFPTHGLSAITRVGAGVAHEFAGPEPRGTPAPLLSGALDWKLSLQHKVALSTQYEPSTDRTSGYRLTTEADWTVRLDPTLGIRLGVRNEHESEAPVGFERNDTRAFGSLVFDF